MNKLNDIFKKIAKMEQNANEVKLGMHVELGLLQDVDKRIESNGNDSKKAFDMAFKAKGMLSEANAFEKGVIKNYQSIYVELTKLTKTVKDLGLPTNEIDNKLNLVKGYISKHEENQKNIEKAISIF
jgi:phage host-nuclease inhibitor protein Gam